MCSKFYCIQNTVLIADSRCGLHCYNSNFDRKQTIDGVFFDVYKPKSLALFFAITFTDKTVTLHVLKYRHDTDQLFTLSTTPLEPLENMGWRLSFGCISNMICLCNLTKHKMYIFELERDRKLRGASLY